jgi:galactose-1-phosphate uridylyltransferase
VRVIVAQIHIARRVHVDEEVDLVVVVNHVHLEKYPHLVHGMYHNAHHVVKVNIM